VLPDLTVMGKVIGGGLPAAAFGGRRELIERVAPAGDVYQAGTLSGNPLAVAAGRAALELLDDAAYSRLDATTEQLADGSTGATDSGGVSLAMASPGCGRSRLGSARSATNAPVIKTCSLARSDLLQQGCFAMAPAREHDIDKRAPASVSFGRAASAFTCVAGRSAAS